MNADVYCIYVRLPAHTLNEYNQKICYVCKNFHFIMFGMDVRSRRIEYTNILLYEFTAYNASTTFSFIKPF